MNYSQVFKQSWRAVWNLRVLWIFGFLLALTSSGGGWWLATMNTNNIEQAGITIQFPYGQPMVIMSDQGLKIDMTTFNSPKLLIKQDNHWVELGAITESEFARIIDDTDWLALLIFLAVEAAILILLTILIRYTSESAIIRGVNFNARTNEKPGFGYSLRQGWSRTAARMFLIDLLIFLVVTVGMLAVLLLGLAPLLLWNSGSTTAGIIGTTLSLVLLLPWTLLLTLIILVVSLLREVFWRACAVDELGVFAAIGKGFATLRHNFTEVFVTWLVWLATGLVWMVASIPIFIILSPLFLLTSLIGALFAILPGLLVAGISALFFSTLTSWLLGAFTAIPIFLAMFFAPITFVAGIVRLFQSNLWTLAYGQLPALKPVQSPQPALPQTRPAAS